MDDLVGGLRAGDPAAFDRLVRESGDRLHRFVRRLAGDRWADDLVQETFVRVLRSVGSYAPTGSFDSWLFSIANNLCLDHLRRRRRELEVPERRPTREGTERDPSGDYDLRGAILKAVAGLPDEQRQVFLLREEAGLPFREIARIAGCPLNTALGRMHYAMEHLRKSLKSYRETP